jgi:acetyl esterase/lipase
MSTCFVTGLIALGVAAGEPTGTAPALVASQTNVVYGMYGGAAMLMDVYRPEKPTGVAVLYVAGCGWLAPLAYGAPQLKDLHTGIDFIDRFNGGFARPLLAAGCTVFAINHRAAPRFRHPAAVEDCQRAVRSIRRHADRFEVRPDYVAGVGYSSGGHLVEMLGLVTMFSEPDSEELRTARQASPLTHVSADDAPHLLIHGAEDEVIPVSQAERLAEKLREAGVPVELLKLPGGTHMNIRPPGAADFAAAMTDWIERHRPAAPANPGGKGK